MTYCHHCCVEGKLIMLNSIKKYCSIKSLGYIFLIKMIWVSSGICSKSFNDEKYEETSEAQSHSFLSPIMHEEEGQIRYLANQAKGLQLANGINLNSLQVLLKPRNVENLPPITVIDVRPNITSSKTHIKNKLIYGFDISHPLEINPHAERILQEIVGLCPESKILITMVPEIMLRYNSNIINLSIGLGERLPNDGDLTVEFLNELYRDNPKFFKSKFRNYLANKQCLEQWEAFQKYKFVDEYFLNKYSNIINRISEKNIQALGFKPLLTKKINKIFQAEKSYLTSLCLNNEFLAIQSLSNCEGTLTTDNCTFNDLELNNPKRNCIIFVKCLYYSSERNEIILPPSEVPGNQFCDRTICVVLPVDESKGLPDELLFGMSNNSQAAPWVSACAHYLNALCIDNNRRTFSAYKLAEYILKGASPKFLNDSNDKVNLNGKTYSFTYGVGILNMEKTFELARYELGISKGFA